MTKTFRLRRARLAAPSIFVFCHLFSVLCLLVGCAPLVRKPMRSCPGSESVNEALSILRPRLESAVAIKVTGRCRLKYYSGGKLDKESFVVKLWADPPAKVYLQGDIGFNAKGVVLGSNEREFWLSIKPKEINSYWWGRWSEQDGPGGLMVSPKMVLEAFGITEVGSEEDWSLSREGDFDVLTKRDGRDAIIKKVYVDSCDYLMRKIEYFDAGKAVIIAELDRYRGVTKGFFVPSVIKIVSHPTSDEKDIISFTLSLESIKPTDFTEKQRNRMFVRPESHRFKHIYKIVDSDIIEQSQK